MAGFAKKALPPVGNGSTYRGLVSLGGGFKHRVGPQVCFGETQLGLMETKSFLRRLACELLALPSLHLGAEPNTPKSGMPPPPLEASAFSQGGSQKTSAPHRRGFTTEEAWSGQEHGALINLGEPGDPSHFKGSSGQRTTSELNSQ